MGGEQSVMFAAARMWLVSHQHGYATAADSYGGGRDWPCSALLAAIAGSVAAMPYVALQLPGVKALLEVMGIGAPRRCRSGGRLSC